MLNKMNKIEIYVANESNAGSCSNQRLDASPMASSVFRMQKVHLHGHLLVMLKYTWFLYLYMISVVILYFPHFKLSYFIFRIISQYWS